MNDTLTVKILDAVADDAATIGYWSDRAPATIVKRTEKTVMVQADRATRIDSNGLSECQTYLYERDYDAEIQTFTLRSNGRWVKKGTDKKGSPSLGLGQRDCFHNPHF